jgi:hypothetical protein
MLVEFTGTTIFSGYLYAHKSIMTPCIVQQRRVMPTGTFARCRGPTKGGLITDEFQGCLRAIFGALAASLSRRVPQPRAIL